MMEENNESYRKKKKDKKILYIHFIIELDLISF